MEDLTVEFHSKRASVSRGGATIWQAPGGSLHRVVQTLDPGRAQGCDPRPHRVDHASGAAQSDTLDLSTALDLADAKIELLSEYRLEYPQDCAPDGIRSVDDEVEQLRRLDTRRMVLQARREAECSV